MRGATAQLRSATGDRIAHVVIGLYWPITSVAVEGWTALCGDDGDPLPDRPPVRSHHASTDQQVFIRSAELGRPAPSPPPDRMQVIIDLSSVVPPVGSLLVGLRTRSGQPVAQLGGVAFRAFSLDDSIPLIPSVAGLALRPHDWVALLGLFRADGQWSMVVVDDTPPGFIVP